MVRPSRLIAAPDLAGPAAAARQRRPRFLPASPRTTRLADADKITLLEVLDDLELTFGAPLETVPVARDELAEGIRRTFAAAASIVELVRGLEGEAYGDAGPADAPLADARDLANQPPVIRFVKMPRRCASVGTLANCGVPARRRCPS